MKEKPISQRTAHISVVAAGFGQSMTLTFVTTFMLMYLMQYAGISSTGMLTVTVIMTVGKIVDALNDPVMGTLIDRTRSRWGKLRPYILFSAAPVAVISAALFCIPDASETIKLVFFAVCFFLWDIAYTACDVPYWSLIGAAFTDKTRRTSVISHVRAIMAIATGLITLGAPWIARLLSFGETTTARGWSYAAILICCVGMALFTLAFFHTREVTHTQDEPQVSFKELFATLFKNKPLFLVLLGSTLGFGRSIIQAGGAVFAVIAYQDESYFTLIGAAIIAGLVLASLLTPLLTKRFTDKSVMIVSSLLGALFNLLMYATGFKSLFTMMLFIFLNGLTLGVFMVVQTTMIASAVDYIERKTGIRNDGISFSSLTFVSKLMGSLATLVFGLFLALSGYEKGVVITSQMQGTVFFAITIIPAISCLVSVVPFVFYKTE